MRTVAAALLLAALLAPPAAVAAPTGGVAVLEFDASGPATAAFTLDAPVSFDYGRAVVTGTGSYAGVAVYSAAGRWYGGVVSVPSLDSPPRPMPLHRASTFGSRATLPAGRYRVYVLSDGLAQVRLPLDSGDSQTVTATAQDRQVYAAAGAQLPPGAASLALTRPVTARARTETFVIGQLDGGVATADLTVSICVARHGRRCDRHTDTVSTHADSSFLNGFRDLLGARNWLPDRTPHDARLEVTTAAAYGAAVSLAVVQFDRV